MKIKIIKLDKLESTVRIDFTSKEFAITTATAPELIAKLEAIKADLENTIQQYRI